jgi:hypothetical protein
MRHSLLPAKVNIALTKRVIALHDQGYIHDFSITADQHILCMQDNRLYTIDEVTINVVDLRFDQITSCYKYMHVVETNCGVKGLLMDCCICVNAMLMVKSRIAALSTQQVIISQQPAYQLYK